MHPEPDFALQMIYWVIQHIYDQQTKMYKDKIHSVDNRIVNIYQPYVRPIVRGKDKSQVEGKFGQGKNGHNLSRVRAARTSESWIAAIFFVMNLVRFSKEFLFSFIKTVFASLFLLQKNFCSATNEKYRI